MKHSIHIPVSQPALVGKEKKFVVDCLDTNWISSNGEYIKRFEDRFSDYVGTRNAISCSNGTVALHLALLALEIGFGDEVIVPALTFVATANAVTYAGATPVFGDSEPDTWNMDPGKIESLITPKTKAIIVVHLYGHPCDMGAIQEIARKHDLYVIEDAAEAVGARYKNKMCGGIGDIATFSFYGNKTITTGEGGMVVTNDDRLADRVRLFKGQGMDPGKRYWFIAVGYNYRMTNIQAAIGYAQMEIVEKLVSKRRKIAGWYTEALARIKGITLPAEKPYADHSYWMYSILIEDNFGRSRDGVIAHLAENGIETRPFFYPMHTMPVYDRFNPQCPTSERIAARGINLPTYYRLKKKQVEHIADVLMECSK